MSTILTRPTRDRRAAVHHRAYDILVVLAALAAILQALWARLFLRNEGKGGQTWVDVHARGAEDSIALAAAAAVVGFITVRARRDLWLGAAMLALVLVVDAYVGGPIKDTGSLTALHVPLAMASVALAVSLPFRAVGHGVSARRPHPATERD